jgi:phosphomannomutase
MSQNTIHMTRKYFGTDGIRGAVGQHPITPDFVLKLAHAVGRVLKQTEARPTALTQLVLMWCCLVLFPHLLLLI